MEEKNKKSKTTTNVLHAKSIKYVNKKDIKITDNDIITFEKFSQYPDLVRRLVAMYSPNTIKHDDVKLGLLRSIVGGNK